MHRSALIVLVLFLLAACWPSGREQAPPPVPGTPEAVAQVRAACEAGGGNLVKRPGGTVQVCLTIPEDANQACTGASDCTGHCLARSRTCAPVTPLFGCHDILSDGGQIVSVCLD